MVYLKRWKAGMSPEYVSASPHLLVPPFPLVSIPRSSRLKSFDRRPVSIITHLILLRRCRQHTWLIPSVLPISMSMSVSDAVEQQDSVDECSKIPFSCLMPFMLSDVITPFHLQYSSQLHSLYLD